LLRGALAEIPGVAQHDLGRERCGIVTFSVAGTGADAVKAALRAQGINVTVSTAAATRLDMVPRGLDRIIRASVHVYNDEEEIARFAAAVARLARAAAS
jgi:selenocysteine lyase/cysteine desulfurase